MSARLRNRQTWSLTAATQLLTALGVGEQGPPDPARVASAPLQPARLPSAGELTPAQRRSAYAPLRQVRRGQVIWDAVPVAQTSPVTCGALTLLVLAALGDPVLAAWLTSGRRVGPTPPPELARLGRADLAQPHATGRLAAAEAAVHRAATRRALGQLPWPAALGTPPWALARAARFRGVAYTHTPVHDAAVARTRAVLETARAATRLGIPVPLYTGDHLPRHVVLGLPAGPRAQALRLFEPGSGRIGEVSIESLLARSRPHALLGGWSHVTWAVLPSSAFTTVAG